MKRKTLLVIAAHPDDPEFGCGGTVAKLIKEGATGYYIICTSGNRGSRHHIVGEKELADKRRKEQLNAANTIGVKETFFLDHEDGNLMADISLKEEIVKLIRKLKPDMIFTHDPSWYYAARGDFAMINHNDHRKTGEAALDAVYPLARDLSSFPEHSKEGLTPHKVEEVYLFNFDKPNFVFDVTDTIDVKIKAISAHASQLDDPIQTEKWVRERLTKLGQESNYQYAEGFTKLVLR